MENTIEHDGLTVNLASADVTQNGRAVYLSMTEYRLLLTFLRNRGQILSVQEILELLWDGCASQVVVWEYISRLRQRIEPEPKSPRYITKARGGYMMPEN
jgi:DNA-binding response OmpR family regulator